MTTDQCRACAEQVKRECARADELYVKFQNRETECVLLAKACADLKQEASWLWFGMVVSTFFAILLLVAMLSGCSQPPPKHAKAVLSLPSLPSPPKPVKRAIVAPSPVSAPPVAYFTCSWECHGHTNMTWNIYSTADLKNWSLVTNVGEMKASIPIKTANQWFWVTALSEFGCESAKPVGWVHP